MQQRLTSGSERLSNEVDYLPMTSPLIRDPFQWQRL